MSNVKVGDVITDYNFESVLAGTKLVRVGTTEIVERETSGGYYFTDHSSAQGEFVVISVPEVPAVPKLDLTDKSDLALALYRQRTNSEDDKVPGYSQEDWDRLAAWVLANFEVKTARSARRGDRVRVVNADHDWASSWQIGKEGTVREEVDSDETLYVELDDQYSSYYIHHQELELV